HQSARQVLHGDDRDQFERARRRLGQHAGGLRTVPRRGDDGFDGKRRGAAQDRPDIVRVGDLVEHQHDAGRRQILDVGRGQGVGLGDQALMHRVRRQPCGQRIGPHQLRLDRLRDAVFGEAAYGIFRRQQAADAARGIGERRSDAVPAVQDDRPRAVGTQVGARPARCRATKRMFAAAQSVRPLGLDATMSNILAVDFAIVSDALATMSVSPASDLLQEGLVLHRRGAVAEAAARYAQVLRADPANADALYYLALIACQHGRFEEGAELARKSLAGDPNQARGHVILGRALHALGSHADALSSFDSAIALSPDLAPAHANRADVLSKTGRNAEALDSYDRALALAPDSVADWMNRGVALIALNRHDEAVASFDRGYALDPAFAQADDFRAPRLLSKLRVCDWMNLAAETEELLAMVKAGKPLSVPYAIVFVPASPAAQLA